MRGSSKHHVYTLMGKVGNGNFGEAFLVSSNLDENRYIMKVRFSNSEDPSVEPLQVVEVADLEGGEADAAAEPLLRHQVPGEFR
jgi:hypothetical protein